MLNKEKWKKELKELRSHTNEIGVTHDGRPEACEVLTDRYFRCGKCKFNDRWDSCSNSHPPFEAWLDEEYYEPTPKLTSGEIEELKYYYHHGAVSIQYGRMSWCIADVDQYFEEVVGAVLYCNYDTLDVRKTYDIHELLKGVTL